MNIKVGDKVRISKYSEELVVAKISEDEAKLFVYEYPDDIGNLRCGSTVAGDDYYTYDEALQATIEALKQPKE